MKYVEFVEKIMEIYPKGKYLNEALYCSDAIYEEAEEMENPMNHPFLIKGSDYYQSILENADLAEKDGNKVPDWIYSDFSPEWFCSKESR